MTFQDTNPPRRPAMTRWLRVAVVAAALLGAPTATRAQTIGDVVNGLGTIAGILTGGGGHQLQMIANQMIQIGHQVTSITTLNQQYQELQDQLDHMRDEALGQVGPLGDAFRTLSRADAQTLLNTGFGNWRTRLSGTSGNVAAALASLDGSSLSDFLVTELAAADVIGDADLRALFPANPTGAGAMADAWTTAREHGDRIRAGDLATAEAAGRVTALLRAAQVDIDGRRGQTDLSNTALQQAQIANQLTAAEMQVALAQLQAIEAQQQALARHEAELLHRAEMARWVARERAAQTRAATYRNALDDGQERADWRNALRLVR